MQSKNTKRAIATYAMVTALVLSAVGTPVKAVGQWEETNGTWKYTNEGKPISGWKNIGGCWYAFNVDGSMKTGWVASDEKWYFMGQSGVMQESGWVNVDGADYYLKGTGIMATDFIKDGYELDSTGKAIPMTQTKSVEFTENMDLTDQTIEGNLYIDAAKFKELELSGITVTGKVVIIGNNIKDSKITIKDSSVNTISTQGRNAEIILSGKTTVDNIQMEENASVKPAEGYTGKVATIEIQSTAKNEVKIEVPSKTVTSNTFAPVSINAPINNLAVNKKTDLKVNANVDNILVNKTATDTKVEVEKNVTVGSIASDTKVDVGGAGKVEDVKGDDVVNETEKPSRPSTGGGSSGGSDRPTPPITPETPTGTGVSSSEELIIALNSTATEIYVKDSFTLTEQIDITRPITFNGNGKKLTASTSILESLNAKSVVIVRSPGTKVKSLTIEVTDNAPSWQGIYGIQVYDATGVVLEDATVSGADGGILVNAAEVELRGTTNVTGNEFGGIEVSKGKAEGLNIPKLTLGSNATLVNADETAENPTIWAINQFRLNGVDALFEKQIAFESKWNYYLKQENVTGAALVTNQEDLIAALADSTIESIVLENDIDLSQPLEVSTPLEEERFLIIDGNNYTLKFKNEELEDWDALIQVGGVLSQNTNEILGKYSGVLRIQDLQISYEDSKNGYVKKGISFVNAPCVEFANCSITGAKESLYLFFSEVILLGEIKFGDVEDKDSSAIMVGSNGVLAIEERTTITNENEKNGGSTVSLNQFNNESNKPGELIDHAKILKNSEIVGDFHRYFLDITNDKYISE